MIDQALAIIKNDYPTAFADGRTAESTKVILSDEILRLPRKVLDQAQKTINELYEFSRSSEQLKNLRTRLSEEDQKILDRRPKNQSVLMSYDFHYDLITEQMSLIEVNTNAALFLYGELLYRAHNIQLNFSPLELLVKSFVSESAAWGKKLSRIHLIDEELEKQRAYPEFLMFKDLFSKHGVELKVLDIQDPEVLKDSALIYNRYTDFTIHQDRSSHLRQAYMENSNIFSPNPWEYLVLADKDRMQDFSDANVSETIIPQKEFRNFADADSLWAERKKYFFKPKRSHGSKSVFNGGSISKKRFLEIFPENYIAQELRPPSEVKGWKFDLRFYVYQTQIQLYVARLYKGQLTNFATPGGGLTPILFD